MRHRDGLDSNRWDLLARACAKTLDEPLHNLEIHRSGALVANGSGRLFVKEDGRISVECYVQRNGEPKYGERETYEANIVPEGSYYDLRAVNTQHEAVSARFAGASVRGHKLEEWQFEPTTVSIDRSINGRHDNIGEETLDFLRSISFRSIIDWPSDLPCLCLSQRSHSRFPGQEDDTVSGSLARDWWDLYVDGTTYFLEKLTPEYGELTVYAGIRPASVLRTSAFRFLNALSFIVGTELREYGHELSWGCRNQIVLRNASARKSQKVGDPVPTTYRTTEAQQHWKAAVRDFVTFLTRNVDLPVIPYLSMVWNSCGGYFENHCLVLSTAIEGLISWIVLKSPYSLDVERPECKEFSDLKAAALKHLEENEVIAKDPAFLRIKAIISSASLLNQRGLFEAACECVKIPWSRKQFDAWQAMRNAAAHGRLSKATAVDKFNQYNHSLTLLNRLVLAVIGYDGMYVDYAPRGTKNEWLRGSSCEVSIPPVASKPYRPKRESRIW